MIKYRVNGWKEEIEKIEVERETEHFIVLKDKWYNGKNRRESKEGYFDTWEEARSHLVEKLKQTIQRAGVMLNRNKNSLQKLLDLRNPGKHTERASELR